MPQREFWTERHPVEVRWRYWSDPSDPDGCAQLAMTVYDQGGQMMEHATTLVPGELVHEQVGTALAESWEGYLFGARHDGPRALKLVEQRFRKMLRRLRSI